MAETILEPKKQEDGADQKASPKKAATSKKRRFSVRVAQLGGVPFECEAVDGQDAEDQARRAIHGLSGRYKLEVTEIE